MATSGAAMNLQRTSFRDIEMSSGIPVVSATLEGAGVSVQGGTFDNVTADPRFQVADGARVFVEGAPQDVVDMDSGSTAQTEALASVPASLTFLNDTDAFVTDQQQVLITEWHAA